jgi:transcriptional regulator with GAF, ATPase, and Fis domain
MARLALRVLLVEDNPDDARMLGFELEADYDARVERVWTEGAYRAKLGENPDIILADYSLPQFSALAALKVLRELELDIPLIVVTGTIGEDKAVECIHLGAADYLLKDRLTRLAPAVGRALQEKAARDAKRAAEEALRERLHFEELLARSSRRLLHAPAGEVDAALVQLLHTIAPFHRADQVIVRSFDPESGAATMTHRWRSATARVAEPEPVVEAGDLDWGVGELLRGEAILVARADLPPGAGRMRRYLEERQVLVQGVFPLLVENELVGLLGLQWSAAPSSPREELLNRLTVFSDIVASALARSRAEQQRAQAFKELERLKRAAELERDYLREEVRGPAHGEVIGASHALRSVLELVDAVASTRATVLIRGESGAGKEVVARAIHQRSDRSNGPLVRVNCASIPRELFESEFFGHVKGSFTGALRNRAGRFELADGGTIFLDEVGEIPQDMQAKLLRVLQEGEFERVGDDRTRHVDVRVIAATNRNLEAEVEAGTFRRDLYYRLNVFPIEVPPLRERRADILPLAEHFLERSQQEQRRSGLTLSPEDRTLLEGYDWPGNVRELAHVIERAVILSAAPPLRLDLALNAGGATSATRLKPNAILTDAELRELERDNLLAALAEVNFRVSGPGGAAELLGLSPSTLRDRMKSLNIQRKDA